MIGSTRFNTKKAVAEDAQFIREVKEEGKKKAFISEYMYFYRSNAENSLTDKAAAGKVPELARMMGVSYNSVYSEISRGYGGYHKVVIDEPKLYPTADGGFWYKEAKA